MTSLIEIYGVTALAVAAFAFFAGGFVKGAVGFALPLIAVTGSASVLPATTAVAMVILPVTLSNLVQALREGVGPLMETARRFWLMNLLVVVVIIFSAQLLPGLDERVFFAGLGALVATFAFTQLLGWRPTLSARAERPVGVGVGAIAGFFGGLAGIWGPPVILYFTALRLSKADQVRAAGLCFFLGAMVLAPAHVVTGVLNEHTVWLSAAAILPTLAGQALGRALLDQIDLEFFRRLTLIVLCLTALNLLRRAVM